MLGGVIVGIFWFENKQRLEAAAFNASVTVPGLITPPGTLPPKPVNPKYKIEWRM